MKTLIHGDCLVELPKLKSNSINHAFTSPPYNRKRNDKYSEFTDINHNWYEMNVLVINELLRITTGHVFYNIQAIERMCIS